MGSPEHNIIPVDPTARAIWVLAQLKARRESYASVGLRAGKTRWAARKAMFQPSAKLEREIAKAVDVPVEKLFPERFDARGRRLMQERGAAA